jgi:hypothetical protein
MDRQHLQKLARMRLQDAKSLLGRKRWSAAYYLSGYVVECSLKACLLKHLGESSSLFGDPGYLKRLSGCWTHDLVLLVDLAGLPADFGSARGANPVLGNYWGIVKDWKETSRYEEKMEIQATEMFTAVSQKPDGVFLWIQSRW